MGSIARAPPLNQVSLHVFNAKACLQNNGTERSVRFIQGFQIFCVHGTRHLQPAV